MSSHVLCRFLVALCLLFPYSAGRCFGAAVSRATLSPQPDGSIVVSAPGYRAIVGTDGNLHSYRVGDAELIDDRVGISLGAFYFGEAPLKLSTVTTVGPTAIQATDGTHSVEYAFERDQIRLLLASSGGAPVSYVVVLSPDITIVQHAKADAGEGAASPPGNAETGEVAASPVEEQWSDVACFRKDGTFLALTGGTRIWPWMDHQVWEVSEVRQGYPRSVTLRGGVQPPPKPMLEQLVGMSAEASPPLVTSPALRGLEFAVTAENRSEEEHQGLVSMELSDGRSEFSLSESQALKLPAKKTAKAKLATRVEAPGFYTADLTLSIDNRDVAKATAVAGYRVDDILPPSTRPPDFQAFWQKLAADATQDPVDMQVDAGYPRLEQQVNLASVQYLGLGKEAIHGWYVYPADAQKHPGILYLSGYGAQPVDPPFFLAQQGYAVLAIDVRGNAVDRAAHPRARAFEDYCTLGLESPDTYVYRGIVGHALRALHLLATQQQVDPERVAVVGVAEGGGLGLILAALDAHVRAVAADAPMLCDLPLSVRHASWPYTGIASYLRSHADKADQIWRTLSYFDLVNFAPEVKVPALLSIGFLDKTSLPTAVYGVYNLLGGPKEMRPFPKAGHEAGGQALWPYKLSWLAKQLAPTAKP